MRFFDWMMKNWIAKNETADEIEAWFSTTEISM